MLSLARKAQILSLPFSLHKLPKTKKPFRLRISAVDEDASLTSVAQTKVVGGNAIARRILNAFCFVSTSPNDVRPSIVNANIGYDADVVNCFNENSDATIVGFVNAVSFANVVTNRKFAADVMDIDAVIVFFNDAPFNDCVTPSVGYEYAFTVAPSHNDAFNA